MSSVKRVLIADEMRESIIPLLSEAGFEPVYSPTISREEILDIIGDFSGLVIRSKTRVDKEMIDLGLGLKFVARAGAGMDKVDEDYLKTKGILAINAPEGNRDSLAEHTLGMLLSLMHKMNSAYDEVKKGIWDRENNRGIELQGKVVGIYGVGNMGMAFAKKLRGLDCEVIGYDKYDRSYSNECIKAVGLSEMMERAEVLSLHIPLKEDTRQLFDADYFSRFKNVKVFINTARGEIVNTEALLHSLENGSIWGAALDVLENEKLATYTEKEQEMINRLTALPNVLITPHVGGWTYESYQRINEVIVEKLKASF